nr:MAG TPA: hypothetical protein [Caudoviricetes sp.]
MPAQDCLQGTGYPSYTWQVGVARPHVTKFWTLYTAKERRLVWPVRRGNRKKCLPVLIVADCSALVWVRPAPPWVVLLV